MVIGVLSKMLVKSVAKRQRVESSRIRDNGPSLNVFVSRVEDEQYNNYNKNRACILEKLSISDNPTFALI